MESWPGPELRSGDFHQTVLQTNYIPCRFNYDLNNAQEVRAWDLGIKYQHMVEEKLKFRNRIQGPHCHLTLDFYRSVDGVYMIKGHRKSFRKLWPHDSSLFI